MFEFLFLVAVAVVLVLGFQHALGKADKARSEMAPVGATVTYTYKCGSFGIFSENMSGMRMEDHINMMVTNGWEIISQTGLPGHIRLGRTLVMAELTAGLSLLAGGSRTKDIVMMTFRRTTIPAASHPSTQGQADSRPALRPIGNTCPSCHSLLLPRYTVCVRCGQPISR